MKTPIRPLTISVFTVLPQPLTRRQALGWAVAPALGAVLAGCASVSAPADERSALLERARAYWAAILANDRTSAWSFEDASLDPRWTLQAYLKRGGIAYESVEVKGIRSLEGDTAIVDVDVRYSLPQIRMRNLHAHHGDRWRRVDGQWYHVLGRHSLLDQ